jgi:hypothetical protein
LLGSCKTGLFVLNGGCAGVVEKDAPSDLPVYPEVPYAFFGFQLAPSTYSTFGILRFTVLSRLGQAKVSSRLEGGVNGQK